MPGRGRRRKRRRQKLRSGWPNANCYGAARVRPDEARLTGPFGLTGFELIIGRVGTVGDGRQGDDGSRWCPPRRSRWHGHPPTRFSARSTTPPPTTRRSPPRSGSRYPGRRGFPVRSPDFDKRCCRRIANTAPPPEALIRSALPRLDSTVPQRLPVATSSRKNRARQRCRCHASQP